MNVLMAQENKNAKIAHLHEDHYLSKQWHNTKSRMMNGLIKMRETVDG
jgi:hypothetical protein